MSSLGVGKCLTQLFEKEISLIEHGYDKQVFIYVQSLAYLSDKILLEFKAFLLGHSKRNFCVCVKIVSKESKTVDLE